MSPNPPQPGAPVEDPQPTTPIEEPPPATPSEQPVPEEIPNIDPPRKETPPTGTRS